MATTHLYLLVFSLLASLVFADVLNMAIDCGSSAQYTDDSSIVWRGDNQLIQTGLTRAVQANYSISHVMDTMRVFSGDRKKYCYSFGPNSGGRSLVRARFYYGNYDLKDSPPTFDLMIDGNFWVTVETSSMNVVEYEVIYDVRSEGLSVCLAQTKPGQFPLISSLEIRALNSGMYSFIDSNRALSTVIRIGYGADSVARFMDDVYGRIWTLTSAGNGLMRVTTDAREVSTVNAPDDPPQDVLLNGVIRSLDTYTPLIVAQNFDSQIPLYMNMYFSEIFEINKSQIRSFKVFVNEQPVSDPIVPSYANVTQLVVFNFTTSVNSTLSLRATSNSTLPPLINALELFYISDPLLNGTNTKDVEGLASLVEQFKVLGEWVGDPCLPAPYSWEWINCTSDAMPRVTALNLRSFDLVGSLPNFSSMDALQTLDLSNNSLKGPIPNFFGSFPNLTLLNLADNKFSGAIPNSLSTNKNLKLVVTGNTDLCNSDESCQTAGLSEPSGGGEKKMGVMIIGLAIAAFFI